MSRRLLLIVALLLVGCGRCAPKPKVQRRVNDRIGGVLQKLSDEKRFSAVIPGGWTVDHLAAPGDRLELGFLDAAGAPHIVELLLDRPERGSVDGEGHVFLYRFVKGGEGANAAPLLAAAGVVDAATPPDAIITLVDKPAERPVTTDSRNPPGYFEPGETMFMSKRAALSVGAVESLIMIAAIVLSVWLPLRKRKNTA